jgi:endonuclease-8
LPEGDTIFRTARTLDRALAGRTVTRFDSVFSHLTRIPITGRLVERVTARGKHVLIWLSAGLVLRTHLRMHGSWHIYRPGEQWMRPKRDMRLVLTTDAFEAVGFDVPDAELIDGASVDRAQPLTTLGPDLLAEMFDAQEAVARLQARGDMDIADALLDQGALAGIGNIFKSETLYACRVSPFAKVRDLSAQQLRLLVTRARKLLRASAAEQGARLPFQVYGRNRRPCRRCGTLISMRKQGPNVRSTYWCERCQEGSPPDRIR